FGDPHQRTGQGSRSRIAHKPTLRGGNTRKPRTGTLDRSSCSVDRSPTVRRVPAGTRRLADTPRFTDTGDTSILGWEPATVRRITVANSTPQRQETLPNLLHESRSFPPPADLAAEANVKADAYEKADEDRLAFWEEQARLLQWEQPWNTVLDWNPPFAKWFVGGKLNASVNCLDRHVDAGLGDRTAINWEGEPGDSRSITYAELKDQVSQAANAIT